MILAIAWTMSVFTPGNQLPKALCRLYAKSIPSMHPVQQRFFQSIDSVYFEDRNEHARISLLYLPNICSTRVWVLWESQFLQFQKQCIISWWYCRQSTGKGAACADSEFEYTFERRFFSQISRNINIHDLSFGRHQGCNILKTVTYNAAEICGNCFDSCETMEEKQKNSITCWRGID